MDLAGRTQARDLTVASHGGAQIGYRDFGGSGRPMLFIPGWVCPQIWWDATIEHLPPLIRAITFDYPGVGRSNLGRRQWALENFARDARSVMEALDLRDVVLVGHSMGGAVALETACLCDDRVSMVIGCDAFTYPEFYPRFDERGIDGVLGPYRADFVTTMKEGIGVYFHPGGDASLKEMVSDTMAAADPDSAIDTMEHFLRWDMEASLRRCPVPVATVNAEYFLRPHVAQQYACEIEIRTLAGVGHFLMLEKPGELAVLLIELSERVQRSNASALSG